METRANYVLIGLFTLAALLGAAGFVYWFQQLGDKSERAFYRVLFEGPVAGLRTGSAVQFNGIRVGEVTRLELDPANTRQVIATIGVNARTPIRNDTQIGLSFQGLTGIAAMSMTGGTLTREPLTSADGRPPLLKADPALSRDVTEAARELITRLDAFVQDNQTSFGASIRNLQTMTTTMDQFLSENRGSLAASIKNLETVTGTLAGNSERFDRIMAGIDNLAGGPEGNGEIQQAARSIRQLAESLDKRTAELTAGLNRFTASGTREVENLSAEARRTLSELDRAVRNFDRNPQRLLFGGGNNVPNYNGRR